MNWIQPGPQRMLVRSMRLEAERVLSLRLEPLDGPVAPWEPGAHVDLTVSDGTRRQYSLCGSPSDPDYRIAVLHEPEGRGGSVHVHSAVRPGDVLEVGGPRNHFALEGDGPVVLIAGGIGVTPLLPMAGELARAGRDWSLHLAGRSRARLPFLDELRRYGDRVSIAATDEGARLDPAAIVAGAPAEALVYVCGPQRMLDAVGAAMAELGREQQLRTELFAAPAELLAEESDGFAVELRASGLRLEIGADQSILEVVTAAGVEVMTDCESGICGSCETRVLDGEPEHRDYVLTAQEKAANDCMMICVSRSACPLLVLDL